MTALVTPFKNGAVDELALANLIEHQIDARTRGLIIAGTTGETPTLSIYERLRIVELAVEIAAGRVPIIVGSGTNCTRSSIELQEHAKNRNADAGLVVTPYYNKPSQEGLLAHFEAIANSVSLPIIVYNIPSRSVIDMEAETLAKLAEHANIIGIKDATGDIDRVRQYKALMNENDFVQLSGDDATSLAYNQAGGAGAISVTSNLAPHLCSDFQNACEQKNWEEAERLDRILKPLHTVLFAAPNPAPLKYGLSLLGLCEADVRLPMVLPPESVKADIHTAMKVAGLL